MNIFNIIFQYIRRWTQDNPTFEIKIYNIICAIILTKHYFRQWTVLGVSRTKRNWNENCSKLNITLVGRTCRITNTKTSKNTNTSRSLHLVGKVSFKEFHGSPLSKDPQISKTASWSLSGSRWWKNFAFLGAVPLIGWLCPKIYLQTGTKVV